MKQGEGKYRQTGPWPETRYMPEARPGLRKKGPRGAMGGRTPFIEKLTAMFSKIIAGTVSREEGAILINHLVRENRDETINSLAYLIENPPRNVFQKTVLHTIALARNKALFRIMADSVHSKNEDVSFMAASELARLRTDGAREALIQNLDHDIFHVRRNAAVALARDYGEEGIEILRNHILSHEEPFYRATSAQGLASAGIKGIEALFSLLASEKPGPALTAAETIAGIEGTLDSRHLAVAIEALMRAGDSRDIPLAVELLKVMALFGKKALKYETFIAAFAADSSESIRLEAQKTLQRIRRSV